MFWKKRLALMEPMEELDDLLAAVGDGLPYAEVTRQVLDCISVISALPAYEHPNGFLVFDLAQVDQLQLRLHIWDSNSLGQKAHSIHDHVYSVESVVIDGCIRQTTWSTRSEGDQSLKEFEVDYRGKASTMKQTGRCLAVSPDAVDIFRAGTRYSLPEGVFHSVEVLEVPTATLFLRAMGQSNAKPRVLGERADERIVSPRTAVDRDRSKNAVRSITRDLS